MDLKRLKHMIKKIWGEPNTLAEFLNYGYENYKTDSYDLVFYNHGGAIHGAMSDDFSQDLLSLTDFSKALKKSPFDKNNKINTVLFRTCLNSTIEVAQVFAPYADYLIASEEITNGAAITSVLNYFNDVDVDDDAVEYGKKFIDAYIDQMEVIDAQRYGTVPMYSIVDLSKIDNVLDEVNSFFKSIDLKNNYNDIIKLRSELYQYGYTTYNYTYYDAVDLYYLIDEIDNYASKNSKDVLEAIDDAVLYNWSEEKNSYGLSVFFPYRSGNETASYFLKEYSANKDLNDYYKFINTFYNYRSSNGNSSFATSDIVKNETTVSNREFTLKLTDEQKKDYAESLYMVFRKDKDGLYNPVYSSDNTILTKDGILKTNISNNLIKLYSKKEPSEEAVYITTIERNVNGKKILSTGGVLESFEGDISDWKTTGVTVYFGEKDKQPIISNYVQIDDGETASGSVVDPKNYTTLALLSSSYKILDKDGNYTPNWDNNGVIKGYEDKLDNLLFKYASLDDGEEYYCVFKVTDIFGNVYYSKLLNI